jgi:NAD+ diphosphatase
MIDTSRLAFNHNALNRDANRRGDAAWLAAQYSSPQLRLVKLHGDKVVMADGKLAVERGAIGDDTVFLGIDGDGNPWAATRAASEDNTQDLRSLALENILPADQIGILAQARSLLHWHERHGFCAHCGAKTAMLDAGYRRHCAACTADHFPRTDPVIIIVVKKPGHILLGRQASWTPGMYSALAGFMEPGETIEDAARREVFEESGIRLGAVGYVASQPWPFPASLMIGLHGEALSDEIRIDEKELEEARWFSLDEARMMVDRTHPQGLWATRPQAIAHLLVTEALG